MTGFFTSQGKLIPVTVVEAGPCTVTQIKTIAKDGYNALQLGFGTRKTKRINKPLRGHLKSSGDKPFAFMREVPVDNPAEYVLGQDVTLDLFEIGERVDVVGTTKGRGFAGVIKRHGFHRGPAGHGSKNVRPPGSIGCSASPSKVTKGKKMPGQYGTDQQTVRNIEIVDIRPQENLIFLKGAVPGSVSSLVMMKKLKFATKNS